MPARKPRHFHRLRRYAGCRLYDPENKVYVSAADLQPMMRAGIAISVREVETGQDVTHEGIPSAVH